MKKIELGEHFDYAKLFRFVLPSIGMMIFMSIYSMVDGIFVSNFAGKSAFSSVNFIMPVLTVFDMFGFMIGSGGTAIVSATMGAKKEKLANQYFSLLYLCVIGLGVILVLIAELSLPAIARSLGATGELLDGAILYGRIFCGGIVFFMLQSASQNFLIASEHPRFAFWDTVIAGCANIVLDGLLVGVFGLGLVGASVATVVSQGIGGLLPLVVFLNPNSKLHLCRPTFSGSVLLRTVTNGSSELATNISMAVMGVLYNLQLLKFYGEDGIATYGVIMYVGFFLVAVFIGYGIGVAPIIGYHYGANNPDELHNIFIKSMTVLSCSSLVIFALCELLAPVIASLYVGYDSALYALTLYGFRIDGFSYLFIGFGIFSSAFFTALGDGGVSALLSTLRSLLLRAVFVFLLPALFGKNGIFFASGVTELLSFAVCLYFLLSLRKKYHY